MLDDPQSAARELYLAATEVLRYLEASTDRHERPVDVQIKEFNADYSLSEGARLRKQAEQAEKKDTAILRFREAVVCFGASTAQPATSGGTAAIKGASPTTLEAVKDKTNSSDSLDQLIANRDNLRDEISALLAKLEDKRDAHLTAAELVPVLKLIERLAYA